MIRYSLQQIADLVAGQLELRNDTGAKSECSGLMHDSRRVQSGNLFVALPGARVDGHDFLDAAATAGAVAALVERRVDVALSQVVVDDTERAMGQLAAAWRRSMNARVVGVTGSNGKTTVKTLLSSILGRVGPTLATHGNYNNEIGVPLTLAELNPGHRYAVVEMGAGKPGDIAYLAGMARPDVAVVTNAGPAHLERLGSIEGVAAVKGELFEALDDDGIAVINRDDRFYESWCKSAGAARRISFGVHVEADVRLEVDGPVARVVTPAGAFDLQLTLPGAHNRLNALAATAAALALDVGLDEISAGLAAVQSLPGRLARREMPGGWTLYDDTYNANPASLYAGLAVLGQHSSPRWLVLGDMGELGPDSQRLHREMGQAARDLGVERLFATGSATGAAVDAFGSGGRHFADAQALAEAVAESLQPGIVCLVKGSRTMHMEQVIARLDSPEVASC